MNLFGQSFTKKELLQRVGDLSQLADAREGTLGSGRADGMRVIDVKTGSGLNFSVFPSRAMDIGWASYKGMPLVHISKSGVVKPEFYEKDGRSFLRSFTCGLLTCCGLTQMGTPCECDGESLGLHGRISNIPAYEVFTEKTWEGDAYKLRIGGKIRESRIFGENLELSRIIETQLGSSVITIHDTVTNLGFTPSPLMLLYHINMGFPLVSAGSIMGISVPVKTSPRDAIAENGLSSLWELSDPVPGFQEQVFFHELDASYENCEAAVFHEKLSLGMYIKFPIKEFPHICHWKMFGEGDYVLGIEPCSVPPIGRKRAADRNILPMLEPMETRQFHLEIGVFEKRAEKMSVFANP